MSLDVETVFRSHRGKLLALARRMTKSEADAEDVLQQAFVSAIRHADSFEERSQPGTWLYRITQNAALMHLRTQRRKGAEPLDALPEEVQHVVVEAANTDKVDHLPEWNLERTELAEVLAKALSTLSPIDRDIVRLRLGEERSTQEVAKVVGLSTSATKTRLHRARSALRQCLQPTLVEAMT